MTEVPYVLSENSLQTLFMGGWNFVFSEMQKSRDALLFFCDNPTFGTLPVDPHWIVIEKSNAKPPPTRFLR
jgi:hypothetical protein